MSAGGLGLAAQMTRELGRSHRRPTAGRTRAAPPPQRRIDAARQQRVSPATLSGALATRPQDRALAADVLAHLDAQIDSARSLLEVVLEQGAAIRARDVHTVVRLAGILRGEMGRRQLLEEERSRLLARSGERLGVRAEAVTLALLSTLMDAAGGRARERPQRRAAGACCTSSSASTRATAR